MTENQISGVAVGSLSWDEQSALATRPAEPHVDLSDEAVKWQSIPFSAKYSAFAASIPSNKTRGKRILDVDGSNRLIELLGLMGSIGEQAALARAAHMDAQRIAQTAERRASREHQDLILRAVSETAGHFVLGAGHSLSNLVLRALMFNPAAADELNVKFPYAGGFKPNVDEKHGWVSLNHDTVKLYARASRLTANDGMLKMVASLREFEIGSGFRDLEVRRGMDFHRRRPQSVAHNAPRGGGFEVNPEGGYVMAIGRAKVDPDADADLVFGVVSRSLEPLRLAMVGISSSVGDAIRGEHIVFEDDRNWTS